MSRDFKYIYSPSFFLFYLLLLNLWEHHGLDRRLRCYLPVLEAKEGRDGKSNGIAIARTAKEPFAHRDGDSTTMAVEAARTLKGSFNDVLFASTHRPSKIEQATSFITSALDLDDVFAIDFSEA